MSVQLLTVEGNRTDSRKFLESSMFIQLFYNQFSLLSSENLKMFFFSKTKLPVCSRYMDSIRNNQPPHIVFDTTISGVASETVKSLTAALGLPTVSASYGQEGDLRQWRDISDQKKNYLIQVMPPGDIIPEVVRSIVEYMNITNAAILYDETFGKRNHSDAIAVQGLNSINTIVSVMDHKYKALLQNIPTRHVITAIAGPADREQQIEKLRNLDINNFFILGSLTSIKAVLGE